MIVKCLHCNGRFLADAKTLKAIGYDGAHFCSKDCLIDYLSIPTDPPKGGHVIIPHWDYKSEWESSFARFCRENDLNFMYEPFAFSLPNGRWYIPDFMVNGHMIEIKGVWESGARKKVKLYRKTVGPLIVLSEAMLKLLEVL